MYLRCHAYTPYYKPITHVIQTKKRKAGAKKASSAAEGAEKKNIFRRLVSS